MSLALIHDTHSELARLAMAGAELAAGDARLKRLVPQAEKLGQKAKVFSRVAVALKALTDGGGAGALLQAHALTQAIKSTQTQPAPKGDSAALQPPQPGRRSGRHSSRQLRALSEALSRSGSGRMESVKTWASGLSDLRMIDKALTALDDSWVGEVVEEALDGLPKADPALADTIERSLSGKGGDVRRIGLVAQADPARAARLALARLDRRPRLKPQARGRLYRRLSYSQEILPQLIKDAESLLQRRDDSYDAKEVMVALAQRPEAEATEAILRLLGRGSEDAWREACPHFNEEVQAFLRGYALKQGQSDRSWSPGEWGILVAECGPSEENVKTAAAVYEMGYDYSTIEHFVHEHADAATIERLLKKQVSLRGKSVDFGGWRLLRVAAWRLPREKFYELTYGEGWEDDRQLDDVLENTTYNADPRWLKAAKEKQLPRLVFYLSEAGDAEAEAYFLENPKHKEGDSWPKSKGEPPECALVEGEGYMIGRLGDDWTTFISRGQGETRFGLSLDLALGAGSSVSVSLRGDFPIQSVTATLVGEDGEAFQHESGHKSSSYPQWSSARITRLPAGRLVRLDFQLYDNAAEDRGFVQLRGLRVKAKKK